MYKRFISIIQDLTEGGHYKVDDFARKYAVSKQTIRNDINSINKFLRNCNLSEVKIVNDQIENRESLIYGKKFINTYIENNLYAYKFSKDELVFLSCVILLYEKDYITIDEISERLLVSRTTYINNLVMLKKYMETLGLHFVSSSNKGLKIKDTEQTRREAMIKMLKQCIKENRFLLLLIVKNTAFFQYDYRSVIKRILNMVKKEYMVELTDFSYKLLEYYLVFSIEKMKSGEYIKDEAEIINPEDYIIAEQIMKRISDTLEIEIPEQETQFVCNLYSSILSYKSPKMNYDQSLHIQILTRKLIKDMSASLMIDLNSNFTLFKNLSNHLIALYSRKPMDEKLDLVLEEVKENNSDIVKTLEHNLSTLELYYSRSFTEVEILYIAVHFCAAIEQYKQDTFVYDAVLISNERKGTIELICAKLNLLKNLHIVHILNSHELQDIDTFNEDLLITTEPIFNNSIRTIRISNLVTEENIQTISGVLHDLIKNNIAPKNQENDLAKIRNQISHTVQLYIEDEKKCQDAIFEISEVVLNVLHQNMKREYYFKEETLSLSQLCLSQLMQLDIKSRTWQDAIIQSAKPLVKYGYVEESYADSIIEITREYGPYYIVMPGVAIAHGSPREKCFKPGISFSRLNHAVYFGEDDSTLIKYIFTLSTVDKQMHLNGLFQLHNILGKEEFLTLLSSAKVPEEIYSYILRKC